LHIAKALGVPFVALFGQSSGKKEIGPYRFTDRYSTLQSDLGCSPCGWRIKQECIDNKRALCLEGFSIGRITKEVNRLLQIIR
jgi:ADP-heptose:LPS heptosyltransferase